MKASTFAVRLRSARAVRGTSMHALSVAAGLSRNAVRMLEIDPNANPTLDTVEKLAIALDCDVAWLATGHGKAPIARKVA